jgi:hypothetical protein
MRRPGFLALGLGQWAMAQDWPQWRGSARDGRAPSFQAPAKWPEKLKLE